MIDLSMFSIKDLILVIIAGLIIIARILGFTICKLQGKPINGLNFGTLLRNQPWLPALLILACFISAYTINQLGFIPPDSQIYLIVTAALTVARAVLSLTLFFMEAKAVYVWIEEWSTEKPLLKELLPYIKRGLRYIFLILALPFIVPDFMQYPQVSEVVDKATTVLVIWALTWVILQVIAAVEKVTTQRLSASLTSSYQARSVYTQARVFKRVASIIILLLAVALTAMSFDSIRELGTSILASAGLATVILGFAAQKTLGNLFAGIQIALMQTIRINDVIYIENEMCTIEEITLAFVVLRIWDLRRLIVPVNYFLEKPFQNFTRTSTNLLCPIFFHADYNLPVNVIREEYQKILSASKYWDGNVGKLQVVETQGNVMKIRALASVRNSSDSWDLKCEVLEKIIAFIVKNYPESLPKLRNITKGEEGGL